MKRIKSRLRYIPLVFICAIVIAVAFMDFSLLDVGYSPTKLFVDEEYNRLFTYIWFHKGYHHLFNNVLAMYFLGKFIIKVQHWHGFIFVFVGGAALSAFFDATYCYLNYKNLDVITVGASGGLFALLGAILVICFIDDTYYKQRKFIYLFLIYSVAYSMVGAEDLTNIALHLWGFLCGIVLEVIARGFDPLFNRRSRFRKQLRE